MRVAVIGTGYVGLVQGAAFADVNHNVTCVDKIKAKIDHLNEFCEGKRNDLPILEPDLPRLVKENYDKKRLRFTTDINEAVKEAKIIFIAVGTPANEDGSANLNHVRNVAHDIGKAMNYESETPIYKIIVTKSTVPPMTYKMVHDAIAEETKNEFDVVSNPEFLAEGRAVKDCLRPSRIVVGTSNAKAASIMDELYAPFKDREVSIMFMSNIDAEIVKYASNTYLAAQVSLTNAMANLSRELGADWRKVLEGVKKDARVGRFVYAGLGFGGSCFPKDVRELIHTMSQHRPGTADLEYVEMIVKQNEAQKELFLPRIEKYYNSIEGKKLAVWGTAFKPETDDTRESAGVHMIKELLLKGAYVSAYEPSGSEQAMFTLSLDEKIKPHLSRLSFVSDMYEAVKDAEGVVITVEWNDFRNPDFLQVKKLLKKPVIFDGKDILNPRQMKEEGFDYFSVGRPDVLGHTK
ncbi:MAG: UDP-glucose/GDP-mannose dehydrogenase family protein [Candidatus Nanoarchaeia archaeon]|nr:UDP-glucose/GDP-mannose dehydrogenase family protein [Candidatus Nanoarchaeia archaeon]